MGSTPHAHALAKVKHPCEQGVAAMVGVFIDTFVMLTLTALVILTTGAMSSGATGSVLAQIAFDSVFGKFGNIFIAVSLFCFGFSSIIGWYVFGRINVKYLFGRIGTRIYPLVIMAFVVLGTVLEVDFVWSLSDLFNGMMVLPNLFGLLALGTVTVDLLRDYDRQTKSGALGQPPKG